MTKKVTRAIYRPCEKKLKKYWKVGIELSINKNTKILASNNSLKSSKQLKIIFLFMLVLNILQYKPCLCILTLPNCNSQFIDQICTI